VVVLGVVAVLKEIVVVEDKVEVPGDVDLKGRRCGSEEPGRLLPIQIEVLVVAVQRRREQAARLPLDRLLFGRPMLPDSRGAAPVQDVVGRLEQMVEDLALAARSYLDDPAIVLLLIREVDEGAL